MSTQTSKDLSPNGSSTPTLIEDRWQALRAHTAARIALGRTGASLPTREVLAFDLAHAQARDAVLIPLDVAMLKATLAAEGWNTLEVHSRAPDRNAYLARPDWGRRLAADSLATLRAAAPEEGFDVVLVVSDGLSSTAIERQIPALLFALGPLLADLKVAPIVIATQARVALADEVGEALGARLAVSLIGERPGLSAADSLGAYVTYDPHVGRHDGQRNCISNIRPEGLAPAEAAQQINLLIRASRLALCSGVGLRFDPAEPLPVTDATDDAPVE